MSVMLLYPAGMAIVEFTPVVSLSGMVLGTSVLVTVRTAHGVGVGVSVFVGVGVRVGVGPVVTWLPESAVLSAPSVTAYTCQKYVVPILNPVAAKEVALAAVWVTKLKLTLSVEL